jgi:hypothetical protein
MLPTTMLGALTSTATTLPSVSTTTSKTPKDSTHITNANGYFSRWRLFFSTYLSSLWLLFIARPRMENRSWRLAHGGLALRAGRLTHLTEGCSPLRSSRAPRGNIIRIRLDGCRTLMEVPSLRAGRLTHLTENYCSRHVVLALRAGTASALDPTVAELSWRSRRAARDD